MNQNLTHRLLAKAIDLFISWILTLLPLNPVLALLYLFLADGLPGGQSIGKRMLGLKVDNTLTHQAANWKDSIFRNALLGIPLLISLTPYIGWLLLIIIGGPLWSIEVFLVVRSHNQKRLGDLVADTCVKSLGNSA